MRKRVILYAMIVIMMSGYVPLNQQDTITMPVDVLKSKVYEVGIFPDKNYNIKDELCNVPQELDSRL